MGFGTNIPAIAIQKLIPILQGQLSKLTNISAYIETAANSLPNGVKCNDPRILDIKQQIENIQVLLDNMRIIKKQMGVIVTSLQVVATAAMVIKAIQMVIPAFTGVPGTPFAVLANTAESLGKNCQAGANTLNSVSGAMDSAISKLNSVLAYVISKLATICTNEKLEVSREVATEMYKRSTYTPKPSTTTTTNQSSANVNMSDDLSPNSPWTLDNASDGVFGNNYRSYFYNDNNVSDADLKLLETVVTDLDNAQLKISEYLQEAPSYVITSNTPPKESEGKLGDYYIDTTNKLIYGPKEGYGWPKEAIQIV